MTSNERDVIDAQKRRTVDGETLTDEIGIDAEEIRWRKAFTQFEAADAERLAGMSADFDDLADDLAEEFYDHLQEYGDTVDVMGRSSKGVEQLKQTQSGYLRALGDGEYDQSYFDRRARIGKLHDMLDMGPKFYLGAYVIYYQGIMETIAENVKAELAATDGGGAMSVGVASERDADAAAPESDPDGSVDTMTPEEAIDAIVERSLSALKLLNLDQQVAMDTYIHSYNQRVERELQRRREVASEVEQAVDETHDAAEDLAASAEQINDVTDNQATNVSEVAGEVSNMSATIEEIAATAEDVDETSAQAEQLAEDGREAADDAIDVMQSVDGSAQDVAEDVDRLQRRVGEIDEVVDVINDIAEQTNILALNASIEAARAGEAGDGFAVVADEVKSLAGESQEHASEIESMVGAIQDDTEQTVESLARTTEQVQQGIDRVEAAMANLEDIVDAITETSGGIQEVAEATDDQAASTEEVAAMVDELVEQAETIANEVDEVAAANEEQTANVRQIQEVVRRLNRDD
ncbi:globin-coupled sensor protein [Halorhabdus salina]|uniref:globin-coupled sensor protein n=1 Tax=Halorhabdus salina TaxID=2750670 RepID=UPI0015EFD959|nr:globin-coupled sensor protein [Halorhabdus salina]